MILIRAVANLRLSKPEEALQIVDRFFQTFQNTAPALAYVGAHAAAALKDNARSADLLVRAVTMFPEFIEEAECDPVFTHIIKSLDLRGKVRHATTTGGPTGYG